MIMEGQAVTTNPWLIMAINMTVVFAVLIALGILMEIVHLIDPTRKKKEAPAVDPVQEKIAKFAASYGLGLDSVIFNMDGTIELRLPSGEVVKKNMSDFTA